MAKQTVKREREQDEELAVMSATMPTELKAQAEAKARAMDMTLSQYLRRLIREDLATSEQKAA